MTRQRPSGSTKSRRQEAALFEVPLSPRILWRALLGGGALLLAGALLTGVLLARLPAKAALGFANMASRAGFTVRQVNIEGLRNQPRLPVYSAVLEGGSDALMLVNLDAARARLLALPWVADASIHRSWPDTLDIRIHEKRPVAIWQYQGEMTLIDARGELLPSNALQPYRTLPLIVGEGADQEFAALEKLLARTPAIRSAMRAATRVGGRRWDLLMETGETIALPRDADAGAALADFARITKKQPLLGQGFVRFDLRIPGKMVVRVSKEAGARAKPSATPPAPPRPGGMEPGEIQPGGMETANARHIVPAGSREGVAV